ncbi:MAG: hypothetical protein FWD42_07980, partial [Solirubrobacterales bacterium]|nr:hypothetical protein [Solirubrobacterales bacterium]
QFPDGESAASLGLSGAEVLAIEGIPRALSDDAGAGTREVVVRAQRGPEGASREKPAEIEFTARVRIDTPRELEYFRHGGILQFVLRQLLAS